MKIKFSKFIFLFPFAFALLQGCKKEEEKLIHDALGHARVLNTDIPVPYARLAYLKSNEDGFMGIETFTVLKRDTADANGDFAIDYSIDADYIAARYDSVIYDYSNEEHYLDLKDLSRKDNVASIPGYGWVGVTCLDVPPLNPEITAVTWFYGGGENIILNSLTPVIRMESAEENSGLIYKMYSGANYLDWESVAYNFCFNDTTYVVFEY